MTTETSRATTLPESGRSIPLRQCIKVDFPEPDGPIMATNSPSAMSRSRSSRTGAP